MLRRPSRCPTPSGRPSSLPGFPGYMWDLGKVMVVLRRAQCFESRSRRLQQTPRTIRRPPRVMRRTGGRGRGRLDGPVRSLWPTLRARGALNPPQRPRLRLGLWEGADRARPSKRLHPPMCHMRRPPNDASKDSVNILVQKTQTFLAQGIKKAFWLSTNFVSRSHYGCTRIITNMVVIRILKESY